VAPRAETIRQRPGNQKTCDRGLESRKLVAEAKRAKSTYVTGAMRAENSG